MSITAKEALTRVRLRMGKPLPSKINDGEILLLMQGKIDKYITRAGLTGDNWIVDHFDMTIQPQKEAIKIDGKGNFSIPFLVETISTDQTHYRNEIKIAPIQKQDLFYAGSNDPQGSADSPHVAEVVSFYKEGGSNWVRVAPIHLYAAKYRVWFNPANTSPLQMTQNIDFLDAFNELFIIDTAITGLAQCDWPEPRHSRLMNDLVEDKREHQDTFEIYRQASYGEDADNQRDYFGSSRDLDWEY
jgi:hypothetical protein